MNLDTYLFLDFDGVLNSERFLKQLEAGYADAEPQAKLRWFAWKNQIDREALERLNRVVRAVPDLKIVVSSSWRLFVDLATIQDLLASHGFIGRLHGETPNLTADPTMRRLRADNIIDRIARGHEISRWLEQALMLTARELVERLRADKLRIAILDDATDMVHLCPWMITTDAQVGLQDEHVAYVIRVLTQGLPAHPDEQDSAVRPRSL